MEEIVGKCRSCTEGERGIIERSKESKEKVFCRCLMPIGNFRDLVSQILVTVMFGATVKKAEINYEGFSELYPDNIVLLKPDRDLKLYSSLVLVTTMQMLEQ